MRSGPTSLTITLLAALCTVPAPVDARGADDALRLDTIPQAPPAQEQAPPAGAPATLSLLPDDQSVYAPPTPPREDEGVNAGGVSVLWAEMWMGMVRTMSHRLATMISISRCGPSASVDQNSPAGSSFTSTRGTTVSGRNMPLRRWYLFRSSRADPTKQAST